jgi:hypothetical protein
MAGWHDDADALDCYRRGHQVQRSVPSVNKADLALAGANGLDDPCLTAGWEYPDPDRGEPPKESADEIR